MFLMPSVCLQNYCQDPKVLNRMSYRAAIAPFRPEGQIDIDPKNLHRLLPDFFRFGALLTQFRTMLFQMVSRQVPRH